MLPSPDPRSRAAGQAGAYPREVGFYRDLCGTVAVPTPQVLYLADDPATSDLVLLMHDLAPAVQGDQLNGCTLGQAELAVETIAGLHASTWAMTDTLAELAWLPQPTEELLEYRSAMYEQFLTGFEAFYGDVLSADDLAIGRWLAPRIVALAQAHRLPRCVVHNDYRLDNLLFAFPG